jgi:mycofactocin precursor
MSVEDSQAGDERTRPAGPVGETAPLGGASLIEEEPLIEEVSIDGMCGVY